MKTTITQQLEDLKKKLPGFQPAGPFQTITAQLQTHEDELDRREGRPTRAELADKLKLDTKHVATLETLLRVPTAERFALPTAGNLQDRLAAVAARIAELTPRWERQRAAALKPTPKPSPRSTPPPVEVRDGVAITRLPDGTRAFHKA